MKKQKYYLAAGALLCSTFSGLALPVASTFAEGIGSLFDDNAVACIIDSYKAENGIDTEITIETVVEDQEHLTIINCSDKNITNFRGVTLFSNLKELDISRNQIAEAPDFSQNKELTTLNLSYNLLNTGSINLSKNVKLKQLNVKELPGTTLDITNNIELEELQIGGNGMNMMYILDTAAYVKKTDDEEHPFEFDLTGLKFLAEDDQKIIRYSSKEEIGTSTTVNAKLKDQSTHKISMRGGKAKFIFVLNGDQEEVKKHIPEELEDYCHTNECEISTLDENYYTPMFAGEIIETNLIALLGATMFNLSEAPANSIDINVRSFDIVIGCTADGTCSSNEPSNVEISEIYEGYPVITLLPEASFAVIISYDLDAEEPEDPGIIVPDTGAFTKDGKGIIVAVSAVTVTLISTILYLSRYTIKRQQSKVSFNKKY